MREREKSYALVRNVSIAASSDCRTDGVPLPLVTAMRAAGGASPLLRLDDA